MDNALRYAEDGAYPTPILHLTDRCKKDVVQLWLVQEPIDELVPDAVGALDLPQAKRSKLHLEPLHLVFGNVTFFGHRAQDWIWTKRDHLIFLQEIHLGQKKMEATQQYFAGRGWRCHGVPFIVGGDW